MVSALRNGDRSGFEIWKRLGAEEGAAGLLAERDLLSDPVPVGS
jgi:hypothetical protein